MGIHLSLEHGRRRVYARAAFALAAVALAPTAWVATSSAAPRPTSTPTSSAASTGVIARAMPLSLTVHLHLVGRPGHVLIEQGTVTGTISGTGYSRNTTIASSRGESTFTVSAKNGTLSGKAATHGRVVGGTAYFVGTATITSGTGSWAHAAGSSLQFNGTMDRQNYNVTDHVTGTIRY
jgi:hypothetical protein